VPPRQWLLPFLACMDGCLHESSPQALSNVLWAAARLQLQQLPGNWLDSLLARLYQVRLRGWVRVRCVTVLHYLAAATATDPTGCCCCFARAQVMPDASALELGVTLGALKALGHRPSSKWMGRWVWFGFWWQGLTRGIMQRACRVALSGSCILPKAVSLIKALPGLLLAVVGCTHVTTGTLAAR
jgi:hypothetical protein